MYRVCKVKAADIPWVRCPYFTDHEWSNKHLYLNIIKWAFWVPGFYSLMSKLTSASSSLASLILGIGTLGITRKWTGACGLISLNAKHWNTQTTTACMDYWICAAAACEDFILHLKIYPKNPHGGGQRWHIGQRGVVYLVVFINNICRDAFIDHFGEDCRSWGAVLLAGLLCQFHLITSGAERSLQVNETQSHSRNTVLDIKTNAGTS